MHSGTFACRAWFPCAPLVGKAASPRTHMCHTGILCRHAQSVHASLDCTSLPPSSYTCRTETPVRHVQPSCVYVALTFCPPQSRTCRIHISRAWWWGKRARWAAVRAFSCACAVLTCRWQCSRIGHKGTCYLSVWSPGGLSDDKHAWQRNHTDHMDSFPAWVAQPVTSHA